MNFIKIIFIIFTLLFLSSNLSAIELNINGKILENSLVYDEKINISVNCNEDIHIKISKDAYNIYFNGKSYNNNTYIINDCHRDNLITYKLDIVEVNSNGLIRIERNFNNFNFINYTYSIDLPFEYSLDLNKSVPSNFEVKYLSQSKVLIFKPNDLFVLYFNIIDLNNEKVNVRSFIKELFDLEVLLLVFFSFIFGCFVTYFYMMRKNLNNLNSNVPSFVLSNEDKLVLDVVKDNPGINQKQIAGKLNYSKSRVSAIISNLDEKELIRRERFGRSFKVYMNKNIV